MSLKFLYSIFYVSLHFLFSVFEFVYDQWANLKRKFADHEVLANQNVNYVVREARKFNKIPTHLTLLLGQEQHSINDLANLVLWSLAAGISFVSFYDCKGQLKKRESELQLAVNNKIKEGQHVVWHGGSHKHKNGYIGSKIHVKILTESDGRENVVNVSKQLAVSKKTLQHIDINYIDSCLRKQFEFPDPDIGVYCGKILSLYAYPPWQIRVTEFLNIRTHHRITDKCFVELIAWYNKCEQRLGK